MILTDVGKRSLIDIARTAIKCKLTGRDIPELHIELEVLKQKSGAFVTLKKHGLLRGCIGYIEAREPLYKTVAEMAVAAAFNDPRFPPLKPDELAHIKLEISVLSPLKEIKDIKEIELGVHGLYITKGYYSGLLLPQVATEYKWDSLTFLEETCYKAGLRPDAWKDKDTRIYIFSADVFDQY